MTIAGMAVNGQALADAKSIDDLRSCMAANLPGSSIRQDVLLRSTDPAGGEQLLKARLFGRRSEAGGVHLMLSVDEPQDLSGARYLLLSRQRGEEMYVYLPAMSRVRRIVGGMRGQPLWGSDFSYEDIKHLQQVLMDSSVEFLGAGMLGARPVQQLVMSPGADAESSYSRIELDIDDHSCLLLEARFFDGAGMFKRMRSDPSSFTQSNGHWLIGVVTMENLRTRTHSRLQMSRVEYDLDLSNTLFNPNSFPQAAW